jgi:adenylate cyclase
MTWRVDWRGSWRRRVLPLPSDDASSPTFLTPPRERSGDGSAQSAPTRASRGSLNDAQAQHPLFARRRQWVSSALDRWYALAGRIGVDPQDSVEIALQKQLVILLCLATLPLTILWSVIYFAAGAPFAASLSSFYSIVTPINTLLFAFTRNIGFYRASQFVVILILPWLVTLSLGGFRESSVVIVWAALSPLASLLIDANLRHAGVLFAAFVALLIATAVAQPHLAPSRLPEAYVTWFFVLNLGGASAIVFALLDYFVTQRNFFEERSETLLLNILPREIVDALKTGRRAIAGHYDSASVLFADIVSFTPMAAAMTPLQVVTLLNEVFECFDALVEKYDLEKIKTIGDCYMAAAGVPRERPDHAQALVRLALDMRETVATRKFGDRALSLRIGINSGSLVAGVIGQKKFIYDLWGDAVNIASRMESHGQGGAIQITRSTYELIKDEFDCEYKGAIDVKGVDRMEVWHVVGPSAQRSMVRESAAGPAPVDDE